MCVMLLVPVYRNEMHSFELEIMIAVAVGCCAWPCRYSVCADGAEEQCFYVEEGKLYR